MPLAASYPLYVANRAEQPNEALEVRDKFSGELAARVALADDATAERAVRACVAAARPMRALRAYERRAVLEHVLRRIEERAASLAEALCIEAGKPIRDARGEVTRFGDTFRLAMDECSRSVGEVMALDMTPRARAYSGHYRRVPIGPCVFVTPFNFPLNLVAHKVAPAIAAGCPFVLKPASLTPIGALMLGEMLAETGLPLGAFSILPCARRTADALAIDPRFKLLSFTGSSDVGWDLRARAGKKRVGLELGGNAAVIVDEGTDLDDAVARLVFGAFYQSGQSCISVQRIVAHDSLYESLRARLIEACATLVSGDPRDERTFLGPLIAEKEAVRLEKWVAEAVAKGARVVCGGKRSGAFFEATLLEDAPPDCALVAEEAFGPVAVLSRFSRFEDALDEVNRSRFGLQAGVFTRDVYRAERAFEELEVGGVLLGDVPSFRVDHMPYGGVKDSGTGREGVRFAIEEMSELRLRVMRDRSKT